VVAGCASKEPSQESASSALAEKDKRIAAERRMSTLLIGPHRNNTMHASLWRRIKHFYSFSKHFCFYPKYTHADEFSLFWFISITSRKSRIKVTKLQFFTFTVIFNSVSCTPLERGENLKTIVYLKI